MADIIKTKSELVMEQEFADNDTRTFSLENPNTAINLKSQVQSLSDFMAQNQVTVGDKAGAAFSRIKSAKIRSATVTYFDLTPQG